MKKLVLIPLIFVCLQLCAENIYAPGYKVEYDIGGVHYLFEGDDSFLVKSLEYRDFHLDVVKKDGTRNSVWKPKGQGNPKSGTGFMVIFHIYASQVGAEGKAYMATAYSVRNTFMELAEITKNGVKAWDYFIGELPGVKIERIVFGKEGTLLMLAERNGEVILDGKGIRMSTNDHVLERGRAEHLRNYPHTPPELCDTIERIKPDDEYLSDYGTVGRDEYSELRGGVPH